MRAVMHANANGIPPATVRLNQTDPSELDQAAATHRRRTGGLRVALHLRVEKHIAVLKSQRLPLWPLHAAYQPGLDLDVVGVKNAGHQFGSRGRNRSRRPVTADSTEDRIMQYRGVFAGVRKAHDFHSIAQPHRGQLLRLRAHAPVLLLKTEQLAELLKRRHTPNPNTVTGCRLALV